MFPIVTFTNESELFLARAFREKLLSSDIQLIGISSFSINNPDTVTYANRSQFTNENARSIATPTVDPPVMMPNQIGRNEALLQVRNWRVKNHGTTSAALFGWLCVDHDSESVVFMAWGQGLGGLSAGEEGNMSFDLRFSDAADA